MKLIFGVLLSLCIATGAVADDDVQPPAGPPPGAVKLQALVGHWTGLGEMKAKGETYTITIVMNCVEVAGGWGVRCDDVMTGKDINYLESDLMGYDPISDHVHWYAVTNAAELHDQIGNWKDDKTLLVNYSADAGGRAEVEDISLEFTSPSNISARTIVTMDGHETQSMTMSLAKSGKNSGKDK